MKIDGTGTVPAEFKGFFIIKDVPAANQFRYQMTSAPSQDPTGTPNMQKVLGVGKVIIEDNMIEYVWRSFGGANGSAMFALRSPPLRSPSKFHLTWQGGEGLPFNRVSRAMRSLSTL